MFFPISWMSPFTVATTTVPFGSSFFPALSSSSFMTVNAHFAASALIKSWGRYTFFSSKPFPTISRAGMIYSLITVIESVFKSNALASFSEASFIPFVIAYFKPDFSLWKFKAVPFALCTACAEASAACALTTGFPEAAARTAFAAAVAIAWAEAFCSSAYLSAQPM